MSKENIKNQPNIDIEIVNSTFEKNNLQVLGQGFCNIDTEFGTMSLLVEIASINNTKIKQDLFLKVNCYDERNNIIYSTDECIDETSFDGYDTLELCLLDDNLVFKTKKCRIYITR